MLIKQDAQTIHTVVLDDCRNTIEEFVAVARYHAKVEFSQGYRDRVTASRKSLEATIASGVGVYGVNTGFGDNVRYRITEDEMVQLQENILRSHGCSVGRALSEEEARALMLMQLMSIGKGYSAVSLEMLEQIRTYLNADLYPYAPCEGTIGGLSFQPYIAITYMGEGRLIDGGKVRPTAEVLKEKGIAPLKVKAREGLALLSNASHSLGVGLLALYDFVMTMRHADLTAALVCEALRSTDKAYDPRLIALKNHKETADTARFLRDILSGSAIMDESRSLRVQDSMNTRIIPHVHGIAKRMAGQTYDALMEELYAVFDNPIFLPDGTALMGSNWDATAIELYCDSLAIAVMDVAKLTEVHMERLVDPHLSGLVSMTMLTALQAIDLSDHKAMSPVTQKIHDHARQTVTFMENDDLMYQRIEAMEHLVESNQLLADCSVPFTI
ncbi:aromatic amino acid lyase [Lawsonibacter sp. LCP25S3_F5]